MIMKNLLTIFSIKNFRNFSNKLENNIKTSLYNFHIKNGGKIINFGNFLLPVQYNDMQITASHLYTRENASLFDVSHMLQTEITGNGSLEFLETLVTADLQNLKNNSSTLTIFTNDNGGIFDDLIITKIQNDYLYIVSNASMRELDQKILLNGLKTFQKKSNTNNIKIKFYSPMERSLVAIQGPKSMEILQRFIQNFDLSTLYFMESVETTIDNIENCRITRCGYTGEDGFELSLPSNKVEEFCQNLLKKTTIKLAGLAVRDSLRLEAGLCLYGNDITLKTTPIEANLTWLIAKQRRQLANFPGATIILNQIKNGTEIKRTGLIGDQGGPPIRQGAKIYDETKQIKIGDVTSGCPSPSLNKNIAMGYIQSTFNKVGTRVQLEIRNKFYGAVITKMPFIKTNYFNNKSK